MLMVGCLYLTISKDLFSPLVQTGYLSPPVWHLYNSFVVIVLVILGYVALYRKSLEMSYVVGDNANFIL